VWNYCVAIQKKSQQNYRLGGNTKWLGKYDFVDLTKGISKELGINAQTVQNVCHEFTQSRDQHKKIPKFRKSSGAKRSLGWVSFQEQSRQISKDSITYTGNTYKLFGCKKRPLPSNAKGGCFVQDSLGHWYVCFSVDVPVTSTTATQEVGIDLGLKTLATLSTGEKMDSVTPYRKYEEKLATAQKANNKKQVKRIHAKIKNVRKDYLHKATTKITKENKSIFVGNVCSSKLAKTNMAKSIYDAAWSMFRNMLNYKSSRNSAYYKEIDERFSTQICSSCNKITEGSPKGIADLGIRIWACSNCGVLHDRDVNAAKNILRFGLSVQPLAEGSSLS